MKNELLKMMIRSKEAEIREKEKELKIIKDNLKHAKAGDFLIEYTKKEIEASIAFTEEYIKYKQNDINTLKKMCNRYKKEYNLEEYKMKLSEFKKEIIKEFGERGWNELKETYGYKIYIAPEEEQLEAMKENIEAFDYINNPTEEMQIEAIEYRWHTINEICNPSKNVLLKLMKEVEDVIELEDLFKHIENDLPIIEYNLNEK